MRLLRWIDWWARRTVAWPLVVLGMTLSHVASACIRAGAFIADVEWADLDG